MGLNNMAKLRLWRVVIVGTTSQFHVLDEAQYFDVTRRLSTTEIARLPPYSQTVGRAAGAADGFAVSLVGARYTMVPPCRGGESGRQENGPSDCPRCGRLPASGVSPALVARRPSCPDRLVHRVLVHGRTVRTRAGMGFGGVPDDRADPAPVYDIITTWLSEGGWNGWAADEWSNRGHSGDCRRPAHRDYPKL